MQGIHPSVHIRTGIEGFGAHIMNASVVTSKGFCNSSLQPYEDSILAGYLLIAGLAGFVLNGAAVITLMRRTRQFNGAEVFVSFLCGLELIQIMLAFPVCIMSAFRHGIISGEVCLFEAFTVFYTGSCSIWTLTALSWYRYMKICHRRTEAQLGPKQSMYSLFPISLLNLVVCVAPLLGWGSYGPEASGISCSLHWEHLSASYVYMAFGVSYCIPAFVIVFSYIRIFKLVRKSRLFLNHTITRRELHLTKVTVAMCVAFFVAWTPYAIVSIIGTFKISVYVPAIVSTSAAIFAKSNAIMNPAIYFLSVKRYREDALKTFCLSSLSSDSTQSSRPS